MGEAPTGASAPEVVQGLQDLHDRLIPTTWPNPPRETHVLLGSGVSDAFDLYNKALSYDLLTSPLDQRLFAAYGRLPERWR